MRVQELLDIAKSTCNIDHALLIFKTNSSGENQLYLDEIYAYVLNGATVLEEKTAYVFEINGTLFMDFNERKLL